MICVIKNINLIVFIEYCYMVNNIVLQSRRRAEGSHPMMFRCTIQQHCEWDVIHHTMVMCTCVCVEVMTCVQKSCEVCDVYFTDTSSQHDVCHICSLCMHSHGWCPLDKAPTL